MKFKLILSVGVLGLLALTSCKKDWNCTCSNIPFIGSNTTEHNDMTRSDAREECDANEKAFHNAGVTGVECEISAK